MRSSTRLVLNTAMLLVRTGVSLLSGFLVTRWTLVAMGTDNYGLFLTVGASSGLLMVMTDALASSSLRHMAHALGGGEVERATQVFNVAIRVYAGISAAILAAGLVLAWPVALLLNVPEGRTWAAAVVLVLTCASLATTTLVSPFESAAGAAQRLEFFAASRVIQGVLRMALAALLLVAPTDRLITWACAVFLVQATTGLIAIGWIRRRIGWVRVRRGAWNRADARELAGFGGWQVLGSVSWRLRMQAAQLVLNQVFGTAVNAAYGVATQLASFQSNLATPVQQATQPLLVASHGGGKAAMAQRLVHVTGRYVFLSTAFFVLPVVIEAKALLSVWVGSDRLAELVHVVPLTQLIALWMLGDMLTRGYVHAINATGKLARFTLATVSIDAMGLTTAATLMAVFDLSPLALPLTTAGVTLAHAVVRIRMGGRVFGVSTRAFVVGTVIPSLVSFAAALGVGIAVHRALPEGLFRVAAVAAATSTVLAAMALALVIPRDERQRVWQIVKGAGRRGRRMARGERAAPGDGQAQRAEATAGPESA